MGGYRILPPSRKNVYWDNNQACCSIKTKNTCPLRTVIITEQKVFGKIFTLLWPSVGFHSYSAALKLSILEETRKVMSLCWYEEQSTWNKSLRLFLLWHIRNIKQMQRLKSQSCSVLVAVRGKLLHADQGGKLLTTSNIFTVCLLFPDCRHPEKALDMCFLRLAQSDCLEEEKPTITQHDQHTHMGAACSHERITVPAMFMYAWARTPRKNTPTHRRALLPQMMKNN